MRNVPTSLQIVVLLFCSATIACNEKATSNLVEQVKAYSSEKGTIALRFQKMPQKLPLSVEFPQAVWVSEGSYVEVPVKIVNLRGTPLPSPLFLAFMERSMDDQVESTSTKWIEGLHSQELSLAMIQALNSTKRLDLKLKLQLRPGYHFENDYVRVFPLVKPEDSVNLKSSGSRL